MDKIVFKFSKLGGEDVECRAFDADSASDFDMQGLKEIFLNQDCCPHKNLFDKAEDYAKVLDEELPNILYEAGVVRGFSFFDFYHFDFARIYENILKCKLADEKMLEALRAYEASLCNDKYYMWMKAFCENSDYQNDEIEMKIMQNTIEHHLIEN